MEKDIDKLKLKVDRIDAALAKVIDVIDSMEEKGQNGLEEERRLAYVGITRAKKIANISFSMNRFYQGDWINSIASRFIDELPDKNIEKNNQYMQDENDDFDFNQDVDYESEIKSPGWIRYQKRIKS